MAERNRTATPRTQPATARFVMDPPNRDLHCRDRLPGLAVPADNLMGVQGVFQGEDYLGTWIDAQAFEEGLLGDPDFLAEVKRAIRSGMAPEKALRLVRQAAWVHFQENFLPALIAKYMDIQDLVARYALAKVECALIHPGQYPEIEKEP